MAMDINEFIEKFKEEYMYRLAPRTIRGYQLSVKQLQDYTEKPFNKITKKDIRHWMMVLNEKGYKQNSIKNKLIGLKTFYQYCFDEGLMIINPAKDIPFPKVAETLPRYLSKKQLTCLLEHVCERLYERTIIEVLYATGVRISELVKIKKEDINWSERSIQILEGKGNRSRIVLFNLDCAQHLETYLKSRTDKLPYVFVDKKETRMIRSREINTLFQFYSKQLGFRVTPHMLRHTFAAHLAERGMPLECIQQLLGHETTHSTQLYARLYNHARKEMYDNWI
ncbi:tyrosine-type recombinase/integrase [Lysinibacillus sphaericus]|nr:tyrosine-type recombinase/integrase [Lysinibacillus sphaericus]